MNDYRGNVSLWKNDREGQNQPVLKGKLVAHRDIKEGETIDVALWKNDNATGNQPALKGKISDPFNGGAKDDDDLPF
jgi:hypothetical protein